MHEDMPGIIRRVLQYSECAARCAHFNGAWWGVGWDKFSFARVPSLCVWNIGWPAAGNNKACFEWWRYLAMISVV